MLPLTFSWCEFKPQTGGGLPSGTTSRRSFQQGLGRTRLHRPSNNFVPGGFGWLDADSGGTCQITSASVAAFTSDR